MKTWHLFVLNLIMWPLATYAIMPSAVNQIAEVMIAAVGGRP
jgi:hypothetical protein